MADSGTNDVVISSTFATKLLKWRVSEGQSVKERTVLALYERLGQSDDQKGFITQPKLKSQVNGHIKKLLVSEGDVVPAGKAVVQIAQSAVCEHRTVMKDLCCDCGMDLRKLQADQDEPASPTATVSMIHNIPELKVTKNEAEAVGKKDEVRLLGTRKLALVVDLDQTMIHTTIELVPANMKDVYHFSLPGYRLWYHTKFRPFAHDFLERMSKLYELHIFTMGSRLYAHTIARMLDPNEMLFSHRIRSRDDCFNAFSKSNDLRSLFPQGDSMVCIIDDRTDVWNNAPNLIKVKPYQYFKGVGDINAPLDKPEGSALGAEAEAVAVDQAEGNGDGGKGEKIDEKPEIAEALDRTEGNGDEGKGEKIAEKKEEIEAMNQSEDNSDGDNGKKMAVDDIGGSLEKQELSTPESTDPEDDSKDVVTSNHSNQDKGIGNDVDASSEKMELTPSENSLVGKTGEKESNNKEKEDISSSLDGEQDGVNNGNMETNSFDNGEEEVRNDAQDKVHCSEKEEDTSYSVEMQCGTECGEGLGNVLNGSENDDCTIPENIVEKSTNDQDVEVVGKNSDETQPSNKEKEGETVCKENSNDGDVTENDKTTRKVIEKEPRVDKVTTMDVEMTENDEKESASTEKEVTKKGNSTSDESNVDVHKDDDDYLVHLEDILRRIHAKFYDTVDKIKEQKAKEMKQDPSDARCCDQETSTPCTKRIIKELRAQVLKGANIVFTGVIPTNIQPEKSEIWMRAQALGARVERNVVCPKDARNLDDVTTHVVAARLGTEKTFRAVKTPGIKLVQPGWLWSCAERWEWVDERLFPVEGVEKYKTDVRSQRTPLGTPQSWKKSTKTGKKYDENMKTVCENLEKGKEEERTRERTCSSSSADVLMASLHPLLSFSSIEMEAMDKEVEDLMNSSGEDSDVIGSISGSSSSSSSSSSSASSSTDSSGDDGELENKDSSVRKRKISDNDSQDILTKKKKKTVLIDPEESDDHHSSSDDDGDDDNDDDDDTNNDMAALLEAELSHY